MSFSFFDMKPSWSAFNSIHYVNGEGAKFYNDINLIALPKDLNQGERSIAKDIVFDEEHNIHMRWSNEFSGVIQRLVSFIGTKAFFEILTNVEIKEQNKHISNFKNKHLNLDLFYHIKGTETALESLHRNEIVVQELIAQLLQSIYFAKNVYKAEFIKTQEENRINFLAVDLNHDHDTLNKLYYSLKETVYSLKKDFLDRRYLCSAIMLASLSITPALPDTYDISADWELFARHAAEPNANVNTLFRLIKILDILPKISLKLRNDYANKVKAWKDTIIEELGYNDDELFSYLYYLNEKISGLIGNKEEKEDLSNFIDTFFRIFILKGNAIYIDDLKLTLKGLFGNEPYPTVFNHLRDYHTLVSQIDEGKKIITPSFKMNYSSHECFDNNETLAAFWAWQLEIIAGWAMKEQLIYEEYLRDDNKISFVCPFESSDLCDLVSGCEECYLDLGSKYSIRFIDS